MKKILYILFLVSFTTIAQSKYITKTGTINFEASVPSFEEVAAKNNTITAIINTANGEFASLALVKGFRFKNALMEEHFNENYAESSEFPKATFKGKIINFSLDKLEKENNFTVNGELYFHGKSKALEGISINIKKEDGKLIMSGSFIVNTSDFNIEIPKIVANKLSKEVKVSFNFKLTEK